MPYEWHWLILSVDKLPAPIFLFDSTSIVAKKIFFFFFNIWGAFLSRGSYAVVGPSTNLDRLEGSFGDPLRAGLLLRTL